MAMTGGQAPPERGSKLNLQKKLFVEAYVAQAPMFNATKAATLAGYKDAVQSGYQLLRRKDIQEYIDQLRYAARLRNNITLDDVINVYAKIAFFDPRSIYDEQGAMIKVSEFDDVAAMAISVIKSEELTAGEFNIGRTTEIKPYDRIAALDRIRECLGWKDKERKVTRDGHGNIIQTEDTEQVTEDKIIFEDHSGEVIAD